MRLMVPPSAAPLQLYLPLTSSICNSHPPVLCCLRCRAMSGLASTRSQGAACTTCVHSPTLMNGQSKLSATPLPLLMKTSSYQLTALEMVRQQDNRLPAGVHDTAACRPCLALLKVAVAHLHLLPSSCLVMHVICLRITLHRADR